MPHTGTGPARSERLAAGNTDPLLAASNFPKRGRIVVTGGAGFLGCHLCEALVNRGDEVVCLDDLSTGRRDNIASLLSSARFRFLPWDVTAPFSVDGHVKAVVHLASAASPPDYLRRPLETLAAGSRGTENVLKLATEKKARFVLASSSEVYGDPRVHPQREGYWGNVNPVGPRSVYDEAKRFAEAVTMAYSRTWGTDAGIVRIFNTFGPRMRPDDGRVVSSFITQAIKREPLTVYGDGTQTRSFCYVDDMTRGIMAMIDSHETGPVNLGNPVERTVIDLAAMVMRATGSASAIIFCPLPVDDPTRRLPDIGRAQRLLGWRPEVDVADGLSQTIKWFRSHPQPVPGAAASGRRR